jgi:hypothetical protein
MSGSPRRVAGGVADIATQVRGEDHHRVMDLVQFHQRRTGLQRNAPPGRGVALHAVRANLRDVLMASGLFETVEVAQTSDVDRLVIALCTFRAAYTEEQVAFRLENLWSRVRLPFWEAHAIRTEDGHVEFEAASRQSPEGHYVTVHLVAQRAGFPEQRPAAD